jgi:hypothetical protein
MKGITKARKWFVGLGALVAVLGLFIPTSSAIILIIKPGLLIAMSQLFENAGLEVTFEASEDGTRVIARHDLLASATRYTLQPVTEGNMDVLNGAGTPVFTLRADADTGVTCEPAPR